MAIKKHDGFASDVIPKYYVIHRMNLDLDMTYLVKIEGRTCTKYVKNANIVSVFTC